MKSAALVSLILAAVQAGEVQSNGQNLTSVSFKIDGTDPVTPLVVNGGWQSFVFGKPGDVAIPWFLLLGFNNVEVTVTDAFLPGDSFDVYVNQNYILSTPPVPKADSPDVSDPDITSKPGSGYSNAKFNLQSANSLIQMIPNVSPWKGGAAFIRADTILKRCNYFSKPMILVEEPHLPRDRAETNCKRLDGRLEDLSESNVHKMIEVVEACLGRNQPVWYGKVKWGHLLKKKLVEKPLHCFAFFVNNHGEGDLDYLPCDTPLPTVCEGNFIPLLTGPAKDEQ